ncbi:MAG: DUF4167 domain-containing protein [Paracoccaceae bacterium]|nr:DUF4167 domain-containing protein [Paracoccaceae bacterium]
MRSSKSRSRNKGNRNRPSGNIVNRVFDSSGPEGKVRGTPQQIIDKYNQLARDSQLGGDRVATENFQQHAEHYLRMLAEAQREQAERQAQQQAQNEERQRARREEQEQRQQAEAQPPAQDAPADPPAAMDEVIDAGPESGLVETPEEKPSRPRRQRRPRNPEGEAPEAPADPTPDAAE